MFMLFLSNILFLLFRIFCLGCKRQQIIVFELQFELNETIFPCHLQRMYVTGYVDSYGPSLCHWYVYVLGCLP